MPAKQGKPSTAAGKVTVLMNGYHASRSKNYARLAAAYGGMPRIVHRIVLVWCNAASRAPLNPSNGTVPVRVVHANRSFNNRFLVAEHVATTAALVVDDDVILSARAIAAMLRAFSKTQQQQIVGFDCRFFVPESSFGNTLPNKTKYKYLAPTRFTRGCEWWVPGGGCAVPFCHVTLTKSMLFHRRFLSMYAANHALRRLVDASPGGINEDIAFNAMVAQATGRGPLVLAWAWTRIGDTVTLPGLRNPLPSPQGASTTMRRNWNSARSAMAERLEQHYGWFPFVAEPAVSAEAPKDDVDDFVSDNIVMLK